MPYGVKLPEEEKGHISAYRNNGMGIGAMARKLGRSACLTHNYVTNSANYGKKKSSRPKPKLMECEKRCILQTASNSTISRNRIKSELQLPVSKATVCCVLICIPNVVQAKMNVAPHLQQRHKELKLAFGQNNMDHNWNVFRLVKWPLSSSLVRCRNNVNVFVALVLAGIVLHHELLCYYIATWSWHHISSREKSSRFLKILIVADPQLQGFEDEPPLLGYVTRYDADRYLEKTFRMAFNFVQPEMVIFLGDLLDAGSKANQNEYSETVKRFFNIFRVPKDVLQLYISGDNDVGGESSDIFTANKQSRFESNFKHSQQLKNIVFYYMNFLEGNVMSGRYSVINQISAKNSDAMVDILVSHMPLLDSYNINARDILTSVQPNLILSAHDHKASFLKSTPNNAESSIRYRIKPGDSPLYLMLSKEMTFELISPTCSYRMGVPVMGYGYLMIEQLNDLSVVVQYTVLWNPQRYPQLYLYLFVLFMLIIFAVLKYFKYFLLNCSNYFPNRRLTVGRFR